jgi:hypothetical protein
MSLPKIALPEYTVQLQSVKTPVRFRPYLVKEEKIFLIAKESNDVSDMERAIRQVLKNCTFGDVDIDALPSFDLEYLFLQIRAKSVNNVVELKYRCQKFTDDTKTARCGATNSVTIPLDEIHITISPEHKTTLQLTDEMYIELQYPTIETVSSVMQSEKSLQEQPIELISRTIKTIVQRDGTAYEAKDYSTAELVEFVESLSLPQIEQIQTFFTTMPKLSYDTEFVCEKCGHREPLHFEGISDFFD